MGMVIKMRYNELVNRLQNLINRKITQSELCKITGVSQSTMSNRQKRNSDFSADDIQEINLYFGINLYENSITDVMSKMDVDCIDIEHIHIKPSCGTGTAVIDEPEITPVKLGAKMIENVLKISNPHNLKTFTASGDSMNPIIEDGDLLLVDIGRIDFANGGIFLITIDNDYFIKRLRKRITGELDIISENPKYPVETLTEETFKEVFIKGRVLKNLSRGL